MTIDPQPIDAFRQPFVGHLPGYPAVAEVTGAGRPNVEIYNDFLMRQWTALIDNDVSKDERLVHRFLERHPSLLPGPFSVDVDSGHLPFPCAVISKPKLQGLSDREPDFMWIANDSANVYPILIEIETPHKKWFHGERAEIHSALTHAQGQLAEWRSWFGRGHNRTSFLDDYGVPEAHRGKKLSPRYVLVYGRRADYKHSRRRQEKRAELPREDERLMSFDRLHPIHAGELLSSVRKTVDGYRVVSVPPALAITNDGDDYAQVSGWAQAIDDSHDMPVARRVYLKSMLQHLHDNPDAFARSEGGFRIRTPEWL